MNRSNSRATDWDHYYTSVPPTARLTRKYTTSVLTGLISRFVKPPDGARPAIVEIGGANSCFIDRLLQDIRPASYDVIDTNEYGLSLLAKKAEANPIIHLHCQSVLNLAYEGAADLVFSVGLVEHFDVPGTRNAILAHFAPVRPGGVVIITFPTPTRLYRITRGLLEKLGLWAFPDERPLMPAEVLKSIAECGDVLYRKTLWPLMLTQHLVVARKR